MATTNFTSSDNLTLKLWGKAAFKDAVKQTIFGKTYQSNIFSCLYQHAFLNFSLF